MRPPSFEIAPSGIVRVRDVLSLILLFLLVWCRPVQAQWMTQTNTLLGGWNAVYLQVDASHTTLDALVGSDPSNPILEVWHWLPSLPTGQFTDSPQRPTDTGSQWSSWTRALGAASAFNRLSGNGAYLVRLPNNAATYSWRVKGRPVTPAYRWTLTGLNFIGFPTPPSAPPTFEDFFRSAPEVLLNGEVFRYRGGNLGNNNPQRITNFRTSNVARDQAYWVRANDRYNEYFGPVQVVGVGPRGIQYADARSQVQFRLRNVANVPVTVTLRQLASEAAPTGQTVLQGAPSLLLRGALNTTNLTFSYTNLALGPVLWNLASAGQPGSEAEVVLGLDRSAMSGDPGAVFAGILRITDSLGLSQVDLSASAEKASAAGLWVGGVSVNYVSHFLKPYARTASDAELLDLLAARNLGQGVDGYRYERDAATGRVLVFGGPDQKTGSYLLDGPIKVDSGTVARPFPFRLILHNDGGTTRLLQKVFHGVGLGSNTVVTTRESLLLRSELAAARRITSINLPTSAANVPWDCVGGMGPGESLTVTVPLSHDNHASNPFVHTYHPDHDTLDANFGSGLLRGLESYDVTRQMTLSFTTPEDNFNDLTQGSQDLVGTYSDTITFEGRTGQVRQYNVLGTFSLQRISDIATLTQ